MGLRAKKQGCETIVVSGRVRDLDEFESLDLSIHSRGTSTVGAGGSSKPITVGESCEIEGYGTINSGDWLIIDRNGIVTISSSLDIGGLCDLMESLVSMDDNVKRDVGEGRLVSASFKNYRS